MSRTFDKLRNLVTPRPTPTPAVTEEMVIVVGERGPVLQVTTKVGGVVLFLRQLNLPAVDEEIGKLIRMRDLMAGMKEGGE